MVYSTVEHHLDPASDDDLGSLNGDEGRSVANNTTAIIDSEIQKEAKVEYFSVAKRTLCRFTFARRVAKGIFDVVIVKFVSDELLSVSFCRSVCCSFEL